MSGPEDRREAMGRALGAVRREGYKVALLYAALDGVAVTLLAALLLGLADLAALDAVAYGDAIAAGIVGLLAVAAETAVRLRRPLVEQFEAANPGIEEALRTARDARRRDADSPVALALYRDVLDRLSESSGVALVDGRRIVGTLAVVLALSVVTVQSAVVGLGPAGPAPPTAEVPETDGGSGTGVPESDDYRGLADGDQVLGEPEPVSGGENDVTANLSRSGDGGGPGSPGQAYETGGFGDDGDVDAQRAGFSGEERLDDAEIIREYNLAIREEDTS
jgi:hypothetical protein